MNPSYVELQREAERLKSHAKSMVDALNADIDAKAAEIERLRALAETPDLSADLAAARAELERLRTTLQAIADCRYDNTSAATLARAAL